MSGEDFVQEDDQGLVEFARPIQNLEAPRVEFAQPAVGETEVFLFITRRAAAETGGLHPPPVRAPAR